MQKDCPGLQEALELAGRADRYEQHHLYIRALEMYKQAVEKLLPLIESKMDTRLNGWMTG